MVLSTKRRIYESVPVAIKRAVRLIPFSWWAGKAYRETLARGPWLDQASEEELRLYQEHQLGETLRFAVHQIPAYRHLRSSVERHTPFEALKAFPLLDKNTVQVRQQDYLARDLEKMPHYQTTTGGTSGNQLSVYLDDRSQSKEMAFIHRFMKRMGYTLRQRKATFRGVAFPHLKPGVFWQLNPVHNELRFSPFHMSTGNLEAYLKKLIRYSPQYLHGYPSAVDILAEYVIHNGLVGRLPEIKAAFLTSEECTTVQRKRIEQAFRTRVFSWYGHTERVVFAGECEKNSTYHHFPDYGILEIIDDNAGSCKTEGERGELVGTGLNNFCMPLIRYRTGDYATRLDSKCECGRRWDRFADVEAIWKQDMVLGRTGARISMAALNMHGPLFKRVVRYQYYQDRRGACVLKVMVLPEFTEQDRDTIEAAYNAKAGDEVRFTVRIAEEIPLTARGKLRLLDSRLTNDEGS